MEGFLLVAACVITTIFLYQLIYMSHTGSIKCAFGRHDFKYSGMRSWMTWRKDYRGVDGGETPIYKCSRCGRIE